MTTSDLADIPTAWSPSRKLGCALSRLRRPGLDIETRDALQLVVEKARRQIANADLGENERTAVDRELKNARGLEEARRRFN